jgi:uncharacterized membrane protein
MSSSTAPGEVRAGAGGRERIRLAAGILGLIAVMLIDHYGALATGAGGLAVLTPLLVPGAILIWLGLRKGWLHGLRTLAIVGLLAATCLTSPAVARLLPLVPQLTICLAVAWLFGRTLRPGAVPLCTQMSRAVHGTLPPAIEAYTRHVTIAWTLFLATLGGLSVLLYCLAPVSTWSVFANLLMLPLVGVMLLAEHTYRSLQYPWFRHATLVESVLAFQRVRPAQAGAPADRGA